MPDRDEDVLERGPPQGVGMDVAGDDGLDARMLGEVAQERVPAGVAALERPLQLDVEALGPEGAGKSGGGVRVADAEPLRAQPERQTSPSFSSARRAGSSAGGSRIPSFGRVCACAAVSSRQRFAYPWDDSTSSVTCDPPARVTSAPVIGRTPTSFAA